MKISKRMIDVVGALLLLVLLSPLLAVLSILVRCKLGKPVVFSQKRPGLSGKIFTMYKFRSMTQEQDEKGNLLPDHIRLTRFGKVLRSTSLDELPELFNILKGDMSFVGPRPQLVRDMVFFTEEQMRRQTVVPGLTGWAQVNGRNAISWENKLSYDLEYIDKQSLFFDLQIMILTVKKVFCREDVQTEGMETAEDLGDYLLRTGKITKEEYNKGQERACALLE